MPCSHYVVLWIKKIDAFHAMRDLVWPEFYRGTITGFVQYMT
jgi:hypothetical protein